MIVGIIKTLLLLLVAAPFIYIVADVFIDISKRVYFFFRTKAKPVAITIYSSRKKF